MENFINEFTLGKQIGSGAYATVYVAVEIKSGNRVAVKIFDRKLLEQEEEDQIRREASILESLTHPHITKSYGFYEDSSKFYLILELLDGGELFDRIVTKSSYAEHEARNVVKYLLSSVKYCHDNNIVHRDLKPENLLLVSRDNDVKVKLADFGIAVKLESEGSELTGCFGSPGFIPPEMLKDKTHGKPADMWAVGVILFVLLGGYLPFEDVDQLKEAAKIMKAKYQFDPAYWSAVSDDAKDLIKKLLLANPKKRLTVDQAIAHNWVQYEVEEEPMPPPPDEDLETRRLSVMVLQRGRKKKKFSAFVRNVVDLYRMGKLEETYLNLMSTSNCRGSAHLPPLPPPRELPLLPPPPSAAPDVQKDPSPSALKSSSTPRGTKHTSFADDSLPMPLEVSSSAQTTSSASVSGTTSDADDDVDQDGDQDGGDETLSAQFSTTSGKSAYLRQVGNETTATRTAQRLFDAGEIDEDEYLALLEADSRFHEEAGAPESTEVVEVFENEKRSILPPYTFDHSHLVFRSRFTDLSGAKALDSSTLEATSPPEDFEWAGDWEIDLTFTQTDLRGWTYGYSYDELIINLKKGQSKTNPHLMMYRRRKWKRKVVKSVDLASRSTLFHRQSVFTAPLARYPSTSQKSPKVGPAQPSAPKVQHGYMTKLGQSFPKTWKRRYFVLERGLLSYYPSQAESHSPSNLLGEALLLNGYTVSQAVKGKLLLSPQSGNGRELILKLEPVGLMVWVAAFNAHIEYLRTLREDRGTDIPPVLNSAFKNKSKSVNDSAMASPSERKRGDSDASAEASGSLKPQPASQQRRNSGTIVEMLVKAAGGGAESIVSRNSESDGSTTTLTRHSRTPSSPPEYGKGKGTPEQPVPEFSPKTFRLLKKGPPVKCGYMSKKGQINPTWKRRFFVLDRGQLTYFEKESGVGTGVGVNKMGEALLLQGYRVSAPSRTRIVLSKPSEGSARELLLVIDDPQDQEDWILAFKNHVAFFDEGLAPTV